jgi:hypothetical protein
MIAFRSTASWGSARALRATRPQSVEWQKAGYRQVCFTIRRLCAFVLAGGMCGAICAAAQTATMRMGNQICSNTTGKTAVSAPEGRDGQAAERTATISGTVLDPNGSEVQDAEIELKSLSGAGSWSERSGSDGEFNFTRLPAGVFKLTVSGRGWRTYVSPEIELHAGEFHILPNVVLLLATSSVVRVTASPEGLSEEQAHIAEQQRILGVFPNFYTSFDWNAPPLETKQKFELAFRSITDPVEFVGPAVVAGFEQAANVFPQYGSGGAGYAKRYGAAYANSFTARLFANGVYPSLFHQDPRYFYKGSGTFRSRSLYAIASALITRGDSGRRELNYSYILGTFTSGGISNLYYPPENRGVLLTFTNGLADIAGDAGANLVREFVFSRFTTRAGTSRTMRPLRVHF